MKSKMSIRNLRVNALLLVTIAFGGLNLLDSWQWFGIQKVDLPPVAFFWFSVWVAVRNFVGFTLLPAAAVLLLGRFSRLVLIPLLLAKIVTRVGTTYVSSVFKASLAEEWLHLLSNTNQEEVLRFVGMSCTGPVVTGLAGLLILVLSVCYLFWTARYPQIGKRGFLMGVLACVPFVLFNCLLMNWHFGVCQSQFMDFIHKSVKSWTECQGLRTACLNPQLPAKVETLVSSNELPTCVFVFGESATRNSWHAYGYSRNTTPRVDALCRQNEAVCLSDVVGVVPVTDRALALLLTDVRFDNLRQGRWSVCEVYRRAGYECVLLSNQWDGRSESSLLDLIFKGCHKKVSLPLMRYPKDHFDERLVPLVEHELAAADHPKLILVHLAGMHYPVQGVIPKKEKHYADSVEPGCLSGLSEAMRDRINRYDDAILYEDKVLGMIVDALKKTGRPSCLFYVSDHGESPRAESWRVFTDTDVYEVPAIVWFSDSYRKNFSEVCERLERAKDKPMQSDELTEGLLELGLVKRLSEDSKSFLSATFRARNPRYVDKGRMVYSKQRDSSK